MTLYAEKVSKTYPDGTRALSDVTLTIPNGFYGLLGPNGAGKSTLMRTIATLQAPDTGSIVLEDDDGQTIDVLHDHHAVQQRLGYLPQSFGLYPDEKAETLLHHFATLKGITNRSDRQAVVDALFAETNLEESRDQKLGGFSGGMKQRFGIAVALLADPSLIIVDEPTAGLDPAERTRFLNLLSEMSEDRIVLLSTHIVKDVRELCTRLAILREGAVVFAGVTTDALRPLEGRVWESTTEKDMLARYEANHDVLSARLVGGRPVVRVLGDAPPDASFERAGPTLEDAYFAYLYGLITVESDTGQTAPMSHPA
ncbi:MAG: ATP-binding cassette domain-containing protein [Bacteroidetes bacterium]|jgi:ABC-type multidrug transport system ATPase subunit|nr:ATP-binding cassette domain-containing protein [Bacteroidota bacterium]